MHSVIHSGLFVDRVGKPLSIRPIGATFLHEVNRDDEEFVFMGCCADGDRYASTKLNGHALRLLCLGINVRYLQRVIEAEDKPITHHSDRKRMRYAKVGIGRLAAFEDNNGHRVDVTCQPAHLIEFTKNGEYLSDPILFRGVPKHFREAVADGGPCSIGAPTTIGNFVTAFDLWPSLGRREIKVAFGSPEFCPQTGKPKGVMAIHTPMPVRDAIAALTKAKAIRARNGSLSSTTLSPPRLR